MGRRHKPNSYSSKTGVMVAVQIVTHLSPSVGKLLAEFLLGMLSQSIDDGWE